MYNVRGYFFLFTRDLERSGVGWLYSSSVIVIVIVMKEAKKVYIVVSHEMEREFNIKSWLFTYVFTIDDYGRQFSFDHGHEHFMTKLSKEVIVYSTLLTHPHPLLWREREEGFSSSRKIRLLLKYFDTNLNNLFFPLFQQQHHNQKDYNHRLLLHSRYPITIPSIMTSSLDALKATGTVSSTWHDVPHPVLPPPTGSTGWEVSAIEHEEWSRWYAEDSGQAQDHMLQHVLIVCSSTGCCQWFRYVLPPLPSKASRHGELES